MNNSQDYAAYEANSSLCTAASERYAFVEQDVDIFYDASMYFTVSVGNDWDAFPVQESTEYDADTLVDDSMAALLKDLAYIVNELESFAACYDIQDRYTYAYDFYERGTKLFGDDALGLKVFDARVLYSTCICRR